MKRTLFFWLEKLKITRNERLAVSLLLIVLGSLLLADNILTSQSPFDKKYYKTLDERFKERTAQIKRKRQRILARYKGKNFRPQSIASADTVKQQPAERDSSDIININHAGMKRLQSLHGIGSAYARRIIAFRRKNGPFKTKNMLLKIRGIGPGRLQKIEPYIIVGDSGESTKSDSLQPKKINHPHTSTGRSDARAIINLNTAGAQKLQKLPGIGPAYARRIINFRQKNGAFTTKKELLKIKGIGKKRLAKIKPFIKLTE